MRKLSNHNDRLRYLILALAGLLSVAALAPGPARPASAQVVGPSWSITGSLNTGRYNYTATLLLNGKVLVAGGIGGRPGPVSYTNSAELYDPATGTWSYTGSLNATHSGHTATLLGNGQVLVVGGQVGSQIENSAELYDPATGAWSITGSLKIARIGHTATLLGNGRVLVVGGEAGSDQYTQSAELYDPATGAWSFTDSLNAVTGICHTATLLANGKVLVAGDCFDTKSAELYDPATGKWSITGSPNTARAPHTATLLANGKVLVAGGAFFNAEPSILNSAELYDPATGTWSSTGNLNTPRDFHTATRLPNGQVLVGASRFGSDKSWELYDPATGSWGRTTSPNTGRFLQTATLLANGKVLVAGGNDSVELFDPGLPQAGTVTSVSAASFSLMGLASEAITASFGARLATATQSAATLPLPASLAGTTVKVTDSAGIERLASLFFVSPTQVNYQIPPGTAVGAITVTITSGDGAVSTGLALAGAVAPSLFTANGNGQGVAAALALRVRADGSQQFEPVAEFDAVQNKFVTRPVDLGAETDQVYLVLFGTGMRQRNSLASVIATIGGVYAEVSFAEASPGFVGLDQVNIRVPRSLSGRGEVDVLLTVEAQMANPVRVNLK